MLITTKGFALSVDHAKTLHIYLFWVKRQAKNERCRRQSRNKSLLFTSLLHDKLYNTHTKNKTKKKKKKKKKKSKNAQTKTNKMKIKIKDECKIANFELIIVSLAIAE